MHLYEMFFSKNVRALTWLNIWVWVRSRGWVSWAASSVQARQRAIPPHWSHGINLKTWRAQSRQSAKHLLQSSELGLPQPLTHRRVCPPVLGGGEHSLAREGVGKSQFRRGDIHCGTLYIYVLCDVGIREKGTLSICDKQKFKNTYRFRHCIKFWQNLKLNLA